MQSSNDLDKFAKYTHLLRPLTDQAVELRRLNASMPEFMRVPDDWFDTLDTVSDHNQNVKDLEFYLVVPSGTLEEVIEYQLKLVSLTQPYIGRASDFNEEIKGAYLDDTADKSMFAKPGIYRRRINLVSYWGRIGMMYLWEPSNSSADFVRQHALATGTLLAGLAAIGAYAAQDPKLYQSQAHKEGLPYFNIADLRSGYGGSRTFYSNWSFGHRKVFFNSCSSACVDRDFAQPSFIKET